MQTNIKKAHSQTLVAVVWCSLSPSLSWRDPPCNVGQRPGEDHNKTLLATHSSTYSKRFAGVPSKLSTNQRARRKYPVTADSTCVSWGTWVESRKDVQIPANAAIQTFSSSDVMAFRDNIRHKNEVWMRREEEKWSVFIRFIVTLPTTISNSRHFSFTSTSF